MTENMKIKKFGDSIVLLQTKNQYTAYQKDPNNKMQTEQDMALDQAQYNSFLSMRIIELELEKISHTVKAIGERQDLKQTLSEITDELNRINNIVNKPTFIAKLKKCLKNS